MVVLALTSLLLAPWKGADLPTATSSAVKYQLTVRDDPRKKINLQATVGEKGWLAAFCDNRICSPNKITVVIPESGELRLQFELIREDDKAEPLHSFVVSSDTGRSIYTMLHGGMIP